jgi:transposase-like protein
MTEVIARDPIYRRRRYPPEVIEICVRWYITYRLSYRDLVAMIAERGVTVSHTTILRWVLRYVPEYEKRWARYARPVNSSWRVDETAISIRGKNQYLYRAVDRRGKSVDHLLCADRSRDAAQAFFRKTVITCSGQWPRTVNLDGNAASHLALRLLCQEDARWQCVTVRDRRYLNNIIEQDHRAIKGRCASMLGFKSPQTAAVTLSGIELAHRIRKRQFRVDLWEQGRSARSPSLKQLWDRALTAEPVPAGCLSNISPSMHQNSRAHGFPSPHVRSVTPRRYPRKVFSGGGLYMYLTPSGGRYWRYKYRYGGKEKTLSLGAYPDVPLECARARHLLARQLLAADVDPSLRREQLRRCSTHEHSV